MPAPPAPPGPRQSTPTTPAHSRGRAPQKRHQREDEQPVAPGRLHQRPRPEPGSGQAEAGDDREPCSDAGRDRRDQRSDGDHGSGRWKRRYAGLQRAQPEGRGVLQVETEDVHEAVDGARDDQDRQCRPDEHLVAQQVEIDDRGGDSLLDDHEEHGADHGADETAECRRRRPAPVGTLAEPEHERDEDGRDRDRAGEVDRTGPLRVARFLNLGDRQDDAPRSDRAVEPEQALPAARSTSAPR